MKFLIIILTSYFPELIFGGENEDLSNRCLLAQNHKKTPGPEAELQGECTPWKNRSCCFANTTSDIKMMQSYEFNFNHCSHKQLMSPQCQKHFQQDLCFYECDPNLGPWIQKVNSTKRQERFFKVPLCASECNKWFEHCKNDYTCAKNWVTDFKWNKTNHCSAECITFEEMYGSAKEFCESIWNSSWEFTSDNQPCMKMWFDPTKENPNDIVFLQKMNPLSSHPLWIVWCFIVGLFITGFVMGSWYVAKKSGKSYRSMVNH